MGFILWIVVGLLIAGIFVYLSSVRTRRLLPKTDLPPGEKVPRTPLQRLAGWTLLAVGLLTAAAAGIVAYHGPQVWWDSDPVRLTVTFILIAALGVYLVFTLTIRALEARADGSFDERDGAIISRSYAPVGGAMMVILAVWMVALTESYRETRLIPSYYLYLIFWSCVMTNVLASIAGILLAYRRS
jgi:hypothetical protein